MPEGSQKRKATRVRSLRQRWIVNSVVPIFLLLAVIVSGVSIGISNYYYKGILDGLERQARAQSGAFIDYFMDQGFANYLQRANQAIMRTRNGWRCSFSPAPAASRCPPPPT